MTTYIVEYVTRTYLTVDVSPHLDIADESAREAECEREALRNAETAVIATPYPLLTVPGVRHATTTWNPGYPADYYEWTEADEKKLQDILVARAGFPRDISPATVSRQ